MSATDDLRLMYLSGTVSIPPKLPDTVEITFPRLCDETLVMGTQNVSKKLVVTRSFFLNDVASIVTFKDDSPIDLAKGDWHEAAAFGTLIEEAKKKTLKGIIFVKEHAQSMLELKAGLTAAESAEYYPPLPDDRSVNHYSMDPADAGVAGVRAGCYGP